MDLSWCFPVVFSALLGVLIGACMYGRAVLRAWEDSRP
jgi:hypothetical protein